MIMFIMQKIINDSYKMGVIKQINIKNWTYYFYNGLINIKKFDSNLLKIDKKSYKDIGIDNIEYITIKKIDDYENIYSLNPLYLVIDNVSGYTEYNSVEEKEVNIWFFPLQMKIKSYLKNTMELETKSRK